MFSSNSNEQTYNQVGNTDWGYVQVQAPWSSASLAEGLQDQREALSLSPSATLVTLPVGDDIRFVDGLAGCLLTITDCTSSNYKLARNSNGLSILIF